MASLRFSTVAVDPDLLSDEDIRNVDVRSMVSLSASSVTNGDLVGLRLNRTIILENGECNTVAADVCNPYDDRLVFNSLVGRGKLRIPVPTLTTELQGIISVEPLIPGMPSPAW